jgi:DNA repair exonuclease SbcCD nuclease subunit
VSNPTAILCSDLHLREDTPKCRTDNYWEAQEKKIKWLFKTASECGGCPILCGGDIFHNWDISPRLASWSIKNVPQMIAIPGQHDLPSHSIDLIENSGYHILETTRTLYGGVLQTLNIDNITIDITPFPFGATLGGFKLNVNPTWVKVAIIHTLVLGPKDENIPGDTVQAIFNKMPGFDLILCGDNHQSFVAKSDDGRLFVSPGSMMRMKADQIDHKPCVYLWYAESNTVRPLYYPIEEGVITREHLDKKEVKEELNAFVQTTKADQEVCASFEKNMETHLKLNPVSQGVERKIYEAMEGEK